MWISECTRQKRRKYLWDQCFYGLAHQLLIDVMWKFFSVLSDIRTKGKFIQ